MRISSKLFFVCAMTRIFCIIIISQLFSVDKIYLLENDILYCGLISFFAFSMIIKKNRYQLLNCLVTNICFLVHLQSFFMMKIYWACFHYLVIVSRKTQETLSFLLRLMNTNCLSFSFIDLWIYFGDYFKCFSNLR